MGFKGTNELTECETKVVQLRFVENDKVFTEQYNVNMHLKITFQCYRLSYFPQRYHAPANRKQKILLSWMTEPQVLPN